ncbi:hypothetical protein [Paracoccus sp. PAR01]|uniref:hypothetical protein n=1 Tax=Paracoccus sp. PAR01 TaxID=2769282 RepID=UPI00177B97F3|nr:hypothetical protein [Paracoccus sp. PAR01]MBD9529490.1 hypothetical protein [Paracoccus sp. PAR01]
MNQNDKYCNFKARDWVAELRELKAGPKALLNFIACHSCKYGFSWYSHGQIAAELNCDPKTVRNHLEILELRGFVRVIKYSIAGKRSSNIYHLIGWTDRKELPSGGLVVRGRLIKEPRNTLSTAMLMRKNFPLDRGEFPEQKYIKELNNSFADKEALQRCFEALGKLATSQNRKYLKADAASLMQMLNEGVDLDRQLIPMLQAVAGSAKSTPEIRTWRYFAVSKDKPLIGETNRGSDQAQPDQRVELRKQDQGAVMTEILRGLAKTGRMKLDPRFF